MRIPVNSKKRKKKRKGDKINKTRRKKSYLVLIGKKEGTHYGATKRGEKKAPQQTPYNYLIHCNTSAIQPKSGAATMLGFDFAAWSIT